MFECLCLVPHQSEYSIGHKQQQHLPLQGESMQTHGRKKTHSNGAGEANDFFFFFCYYNIPPGWTTGKLFENQYPEFF